MTLRFALLASAVLVSACGQRSETAPRSSSTSTAVPPSPAPLSSPAAPASPAASAEPHVAKVAAPILALDGEGLRLVNSETGSTRLIAFGVPREVVETAVARTGGETPQRSQLDECPAGPTGFSRFGALQLAFQGGKFAGWAANGKDAHTTMDGIGIGSGKADIARSRVVTMVHDSTLGQEFVLGRDNQANPISGIFDRTGPTGRVTNLWAGVACNFR